MLILLLILKFAPAEEQILIVNSTFLNNTVTSFPLHQNQSANFGRVSLTKILLLDGWTDVYFVLILIGCVIMSFWSVTLPTLAGDQYDTCDEEVSARYVIVINSNVRFCNV